MNVEQIMTSKPATCRPSDTMDRAASRMWEYDCGALPVVDDDGKPIGMITDRDICMSAYTQGRPLGQITVETAASKQLFSVSASTPIHDAERLMQDKQIRRLPVVDDAGRIVGMLSLNDIARAGHSPEPDGVSEHDVAQTLSAVCQPHRATELAPLSSDA